MVLSDGSGLTSRQCATLLSEAGHRVAVLAAGALPLTRFTRHVRAVYRVPAYGPDPLGWWQAGCGPVGNWRPRCSCYGRHVRVCHWAGSNVP